MDLKSSLQNTDLVSACILTGGKGSRLNGMDKGLIEVAGKYLIEYCIERIQPQVITTLISANRNLEIYEMLGCSVFEDSFGHFEGPLAGFLTALEKSNTPYLVTLPTDAPLFPLNLVDRLLQPIINDEGTASVVRAAGKLHPTFCCVPTTSKEALKQYLSSGKRKIITWLEEFDLIKVDFEKEKSFLNINDCDDLAAASVYLTNEQKI